MKTLISNFKLSDKPYKIILASFLLTFFGLFFAWSSVMIWTKTEANKFANMAVREYHLDKTQSLLMMTLDEDATVEERNTAIWVLGTLKDQDALEKLLELDTMVKADEILGISQYELETAILKIRGEFKRVWRVTDN
jgi:hypothetical protein